MSSVQSQASQIVAGVPRELFIGGAWRPASGGATFGVQDPATEAVLAEVANGTLEDARAAMDAAAAAQAGWAATAPRKRSEILSEAYRRMVADEERLAALMTLEMGKSVEESKAEVRYAAEFFRWFAEEAVRIDGRYARSPDGSARLLTQRQPVGVCVLVTPWNFPLAMGTRKLGPAIAAGCAMVVKPAQQTPLSMLALARLLADCGLPDGVLNLLTTTDASATVSAMIEHPAARKLSFTGSTDVGRKLAEQGGRRLLRMSMELGGNNPFIVFEDADVQAAVEGAMLAKMRNIGEACTAANRFYVHRSLQDAFAQAMTAKMAALKVGHGLSGADVGPLIDDKARDKVADLVDQAVSEGAKVLTGGKAPEGAGWFYAPTVLTDVPATAKIGQAEIFGPVAPITPFDDEDEVVAAANGSDAGLTAYVYTRDLARALRVIERLDVGMVGLNRGVVSNPAAPFGGVKASGFGREGGYEGLEEYLSVKYAALPA